MPQPETTYVVHASDFPPRIRVKDVVERLRRRGFALRVASGQLVVVRVH